MTTEQIIEIVTIIVTLILGVIVKKHTNLSSQKIPIQNLAIGIIVAIIEFIVTKNFNTAIIVSGLTAGGTYDLFKNLKAMFTENQEQQEIQDAMEEEEVEIVEEEE